MKRFLSVLSVLFVFAVFGAFFHMGATMSGRRSADEVVLDASTMEVRLGNIPLNTTFYTKDEIDALVESVAGNTNPIVYRYEIDEKDPTVGLTNGVIYIGGGAVRPIAEETDPEFTRWLNGRDFVDLETDPLFTEWTRTNNIVDMVYEMYARPQYATTSVTNEIVHENVYRNYETNYVYNNVYTTNNIFNSYTNETVKVYIITNEFVTISTNRYYPLELNWTTNDWNPNYPPFDWDEYDIGPLNIASSNLVDNDLAQIGNNAFMSRSDITGVFCTNVTSVGSAAFKDCPNLRIVDLPNATSIGDCAFMGCTNMVAVNLPKITGIGQNMFKGCASLRVVNAPKATSIRQYAFMDALDHVGMDTFNVPELQSIGDYAFANSGLVNFSHTNVTTLGYDNYVFGHHFEGSTSLTNVYLPKVYNTISYTFRGCTGLRTAYLPKAGNLGNCAFENCSSLEYVCVTNSQYLGYQTFANSGLKDMFSNASNCGDMIFQNCNSLTNLTFHSNSGATVSKLGTSTSLESIHIDMPNLSSFKPNLGSGNFPNLKYIFVIEHTISEVNQIYGSWGIGAGSGVQIFCSDGKIAL